MDTKSYEISRLSYLNDCLVLAIDALTRAQRVGLNANPGLTHTPFVPSSFGVPVQGMNVDPREFGMTHTPYYSYPYGAQALPGWTGGQMGALQTFVDPFVAQRGAVPGLSHTGSQWTPWSPYAAEIARQREIIARQQYEAMWKASSPFGI